MGWATKYSNPRSTYNSGYKESFEGIGCGLRVGCGVPQSDLLLQLVGRLLGALAAPALQALLAGLHARRRRRLRRVLDIIIYYFIITYIYIDGTSLP